MKQFTVCQYRSSHAYKQRCRSYADRIMSLNTHRSRQELIMFVSSINDDKLVDNWTLKFQRVLDIDRHFDSHLKVDGFHLSVQRARFRGPMSISVRLGSAKMHYPLIHYLLEENP